MPVLAHVVARDPADQVIWITDVWDSKESHQASLALSGVMAAIARAKPLIVGFGDYVVTDPGGGVGLLGGVFEHVCHLPFFGRPTMR